MAKRIERDASAPPQQTDQTAGYVYLPGLLADEFGISRSVARRDLLMGSVTIDGKQYVYNEGGLDVPREKVEGKTIEVKGGDTGRTYRVQIQ
jgi:hypothetical protein